ncbi:hypothetical protein O3P69_012309 [Scylla paramamosain]|uniref:Uncharacterized protein n=1 Tax=Scylla paramamosain TaxID=85552 RepID=A0AAW0TDF2_SCYPA
MAAAGAAPTQPLLAQDDLRAYAYEGDDSPSACLSAAALGIPSEAQEEEEEIPKSLVPEYREVLDLLKHLPDAVSSLGAPQGEPEDAASLQQGAEGGSGKDGEGKGKGE